MGINEKYKSGFIEQIDASRRGDVVFIPNILGRVAEVFNLMQSRYTLIFGATGTGKTSFMDYLYVLAPWTYLKTNDQLDDVHWEVQYFSLERKIMFKHAKWISWFLYRDHSYQTSSDDLMGWGAEPLHDEGYATIREYDDEMTELMEHVHMYDGKVDVEDLDRILEERARSLGTLYESDMTHVYKDKSLEYIDKFDDTRVERTKTGDKKYVELVHDGKTFRLYQKDHRYFLHNPKTFLFILIDGIGLFGSSDFSKKKSTLDRVSEILANKRDLYGFSPVVVSQQNRDIGSTARLKIHGNDLSPQTEDVQGSSQSSHDADLILALFDPYHYKACNTEGKYGEYDVVQGMMHPKGFNRFRSLSILKNSFGIPGKRFGLKFLGECNHFDVLPTPESVAELQQIYSDISKGL